LAMATSSPRRLRIRQDELRRARSMISTAKVMIAKALESLKTGRLDEAFEWASKATYYIDDAARILSRIESELRG